MHKKKYLILGKTGHLQGGGRKIIETLAAVTVVIVALIIKEYVKPVDTYYLSGVFCAIAVLGISRVCCKMNEKVSWLKF